MLIAGTLLGVGGLVGHYPELAASGVVAVAAVGIAAAAVARAPALTVRRRIEPDRVTRGEACTVSLRVSRERRSRVNVDLVAVDGCGSTATTIPLAPMGRSLETAAACPVSTSRRGVINIGPLRIRRVDPFGLWSVTSTHGKPDRVLVYPRVHSLVGTPSGVRRSLDGVRDGVPSGTITFDRLRPYVRGDELRHVHWRTSARLGELMVREHLEDSVPSVVVVLDDRTAAYTDADDFEEACDAAASVTAAMAAVGVKPTLLMMIVERRGPIMELLAEVVLADAPAPVGFIDVMRRAGAATIVLITGAAPGADEAVMAAAGLTSTNTSVITVQFDRGLPNEPTISEPRHGLLSVRARDAGAFASVWERFHTEFASTHSRIA
jgi:uncharacterized protein (DUF58 family)